MTVRLNVLAIRLGVLSLVVLYIAVMKQELGGQWVSIPREQASSLRGGQCYDDSFVKCGLPPGPPCTTPPACCCNLCLRKGCKLTCQRGQGCFKAFSGYCIIEPACFGYSCTQSMESIPCTKAQKCNCCCALVCCGGRHWSCVQCATQPWQYSDFQTPEQTTGSCCF
jgi:hypothetical protein